MPYSEIPAFVSRLQASGDAEITKLAFEFLILTAARTSEVLGSRWDEIDFGKKVWSIPGARMKMGREHRVPLASRCVEILRRAKELPAGSDFVFPGAFSRKASVEYGLSYGFAADGPRRHRSRLPLGVPGLGGGMHELSQRRLRDGARPYNPKQDRSGLSAGRSLGETGSPYGRLGGPRVFPSGGRQPISEARPGEVTAGPRRARHPDSRWRRCLRPSRLACDERQQCANLPAIFPR